MATKEALRKSALAALQTWPKDPLRPNVQLRDVLTARFDKLASSSSPQAQSAGEQLKAINALLANRYKNKYAVAPDADIVRPRSNPEYYNTLLKDLEEIPTRTVSQSWLIRLKGLFRMS